MNSTTRCVWLASAIAVCSAVPAAGQLVTNGGFESPGFTPSPDYYRYLHVVHGTQNFVTGWTFSGTVQYQASFLMRIGGPYDSYIPDGSYAIALEEGAIMSTTFTATAGQQYQFSVLARYLQPLPPNAFRVTADGNLATFNTTATFLTYTFDFTATTNGAAVLQMEVDAVGPPSLVVFVDNVSVTAIPEFPASALASGLSVLLLVGWRRCSRLAGAAGTK